MKFKNVNYSASIDIKRFLNLFKIQTIEPGLKKARKASQFSKR